VSVRTFETLKIWNMRQVYQPSDHNIQFIHHAISELHLYTLTGFRL